MTKEELLVRLRELDDFQRGIKDKPEKDKGLCCGDYHEAADKAILQFIGDMEVTTAFLQIQRWYE
jgi:hypothetical protein